MIQPKKKRVRKQRPRQFRVKLPKRTVKARVALCNRVEASLPTCKLAADHPEVMATGNKMVTIGHDLEAADEAVSDLEKKLTTARSHRDEIMVDHCTATDNFATTVICYAQTTDEVSSTALELATRTTFPLVTPTGMKAVLDPVTGNVHLAVEGSEGIATFKFEHSLEPVGPGTMNGVEGIGRTRQIEGLAKGLHWFQVKATRGGNDSAFFGPVSVLVK